LCYREGLIFDQNGQEATSRRRMEMIDEEMTGKQGPIRRLHSMFSRPAPSARPAPPSPQAASRRSGVQETIVAPKPVPKRCLNEAGHKAVG
jgi:hypothetical protein